MTYKLAMLWRIGMCMISSLLVVLVIIATMFGVKSTWDLGQLPFCFPIKLWLMLHGAFHFEFFLTRVFWSMYAIQKYKMSMPLLKYAV